MANVLVLSLSVGLALLCAISSFLPNLQLWGVNHLGFYPPLLRAIALSLVGLSFVPKIRRSIARRVVTGTVLFQNPNIYRFAAVLIPVGAFGLFLTFRSATNLLGDGQLIGSSITEVVKSGMPVAEFTKGMDWIYPGTELLVFAAANIASHVFSVDAVYGVRVISAASGAVFVWTLMWIVRTSNDPRETKSLVVALAVLSGGIQLFFGYVEAYAPMVVLSVLYFVTAKRSFHGRSRVGIPIACLVGAVFMHVMAIFLLPSACFLLLAMFRGKRSRLSPKKALFVTASITVVAAFVVFVRFNGGEIVLPLFSRDGRAAAFTWTHLLDILNEILLLFPGFIVIILTGLATRRHTDDIHQSGESGFDIHESP
ncbi:MAG: hypothetical protein PVF33_05480, partial [Candidatus Latescibacterota bacterium]